MKVCIKCKILKLETEFYKHKRTKDKLRGECKRCVDISNKKWAIDNPNKYKEMNKKKIINYLEKRKIVSKRWYENNKQRKALKAKEWRNINHKKIAATTKQWRINNPEKAKRWKVNNPEKMKEIIKSWRANNPEKMKLIWEKRVSTSKGRLNNSISVRIRQSLKRNSGSKNGRHWETLVGYTVEELKSHLEKQFVEGMNWKNHGSYWHIDHKRPIASFNFDSPEHPDFKKCWGLRNLQPLKAFENMSKGAKIKVKFVKI